MGGGRRRRLKSQAMATHGVDPGTDIERRRMDASLSFLFPFSLSSLGGRAIVQNDFRVAGVAILFPLFPFLPRVPVCLSVCLSVCLRLLQQVSAFAPHPKSGKKEAGAKAAQYTVRGGIEMDVEPLNNKRRESSLST